MRFIWVGILLVVACTRPNPNYKCCTSESDCAANDIAEITPCEDGLLCRGNKCVEQLCELQSDCDPTAPYCLGEVDRTCQEQCSDDLDCPGFGQSTDARYCEGGACVECRADADCPTEAPICGDGICRACTAHSECASGFCGFGGVCGTDEEIAFAAPDGATTSDCSRSVPCSLQRALELVIERPYVALAPGNYLVGDTLHVYGQRWLRGTGTSRPSITRITPGPAFQIESAADVTFEYLQVHAAFAGAGGLEGHGISSPMASGGTTTRVVDSIIKGNEAAGVHVFFGTLIVRNSTFVDNGVGIQATDATLDIDGCEIRENATGVSFDWGRLRITNSFVIRNMGGLGGLSIYVSEPMHSQIEFNTIVDNDKGMNCSGAAISYPNNLIARNGTNVSGTEYCTTTGSIVLGDDISSLKFKSPDTAPFDYHLLPGSAAIDAATDSELDHDFDGEARPKGSARDVGADEAE